MGMLKSRESSRFSGEPVNLYCFQYGPAPTDCYGYTDAETPISFDKIVYAPIAIDRGKMTSSGSLDKANLAVTTPHDSEIALLSLGSPSFVVSLIIRQGHVNDGEQDFRVCWTGRVLSCAIRGSKANLTCEPISTSMRRNGLRRRYQFGCPHVLYGEACGADKTKATTAAKVEEVAGARITLAADWAGVARAGKYIQGIAQWTTTGGIPEIRTILRVENGGRTFLLSRVATGLSVGGTVEMVLGCNHKSGTPAQPDGDCGPLHGNVLNFGGQEYIPFKNPIGLVNQFY